MHEEAMLRDLRRKIVQVGEQEGGHRILRVSLWVGALAHVDEAQLRSRWPQTVEGTLAEGARLTVSTSPDATDPRAQGIVLTDVAVERGD